MDTPSEPTPEPPIFPPAPPTPVISEADRSWCIGLHLSGLSGIILGWSLMHIIVPLVIWLIKRADSPEIDATGKEVLNFQISYSIYSLIAIFLCWVAGVLCLVLIGLALLPLAFLLLGGIVLTWLVCMIIASVKASNGQEYHFPMTIRFLK